MAFNPRYRQSYDAIDYIAELDHWEAELYKALHPSPRYFLVPIEAPRGEYAQLAIEEGLSHEEAYLDYLAGMGEWDDSFAVFEEEDDGSWD